MTIANWHEYLGQEKCNLFLSSVAVKIYIPNRYYATYVRFFTDIIADVGASQALEQYVFSPAANGNNAHMFARFMAGMWVISVWEGF